MTGKTDVSSFMVDLYGELSTEVHGHPWNGDSVKVLGFDLFQFCELLFFL